MGRVGQLRRVDTLGYDFALDVVMVDAAFRMQWDALLDEAEAVRLSREEFSDLVLLSKDAAGHEHKGAGEGGGQFTAGSGGGSGEKNPLEKPRAVKGEMATARRIGKGKEAKLVLADGSPAPSHVPAGKIPPAWVDVKVSTDPNADVLATGKDAKGRPKTIYRDEFHMKGAAVKFARTLEGLKKQGELHEQNQRNRADPALRNEADCVWLMQEQGTRPGSDADTGGKVKAYGATTLEGRHVVVEGDAVRLDFIGKEGVRHDHVIRDAGLAQMLRERKAAAGDDGKLFGTNYDKVTAYSKTLDNGRFTPKDFRTQRANIIAIREVSAADPPKTMKEYKARVKGVADVVCRVLGNRAAQALESYIDPSVFSGWKAALSA